MVVAVTSRPSPASIAPRLALLTLLAPLALLACSDREVLLDADPDRVGDRGDDGALGALLTHRTLRVRGDRPLDVDLVVPVDTDDDVAKGPFPPVLLVQGGLAAVERYHWLAAHIASRGFVVVAPHHALDLAFFSQGDGLDALAALRRLSDRDDDEFAGVVADVDALAIGHSLGGVVASNAFGQDETGVSHLVLLSSVPNPSVDVSRTTGRVLSIAGSDDGKITTDEVKEGAEAFAAPTTFAIVDGLTHYFLTDDPSESELQDDGESDIDRAEARRRTQFLIDAMLDSQRGDVNGDLLLDDDTRWTAGVHR